MKYPFLMLALSLIVALNAQSAGSLAFSLPQNMDPAFEYYSLNYLGSKSLGRGHSSVSIAGTEEAILANPAAYKADAASIYLEMLIKPPSKTLIYQKENEFSSPIPFGIAAYGGKLLPGFSWGAAYSIPKIMRLSSIDIELNQGGDLHSRYPFYSLHQATANLAFHHGAINLGLNLHAQLHHIDDLAIMRSFASIRENKFTLRPQLGFLYDADSWGLGATFMSPTKVDWDMRLTSYNGKLPGVASLGGRYQAGKHGLSAQVDWENTSSVHPKYQDRFNIKAGYETQHKAMDLRLGYIFHPGIYSGFYQIPTVNSAYADTSIWWADVPMGGKIAKNDQHFITAGLGRTFKNIEFNLAFAYQIVGIEPMSQISISTTINPDLLKRKKHPVEK